VTVDSDKPNQTIEKGYYLTAPNDIDISEISVVSPLTTLVEATLKTQSTDLSKAQALAKAEQKVLSDLKLTDSTQLYSDFVQAATDQSLTEKEQKRNQRTRLIAQVLTDVMAKGLASSAANAVGNEADAAVSALFIEKFAAMAVQSVINQVDTAIDDNNGDVPGGAEVAGIADTIIGSSPQIIVTRDELSGGSVDTTLRAAPSNAIVDDNLNSFSWSAVSGFTAPNDYEFSLSGGQSWQGVSD